MSYAAMAGQHSALLYFESLSVGFSTRLRPRMSTVTDRKPPSITGRPPNQP